MPTLKERAQAIFDKYADFEKFSRFTDFEKDAVELIRELMAENERLEAEALAHKEKLTNEVK